MKICFYLQTLIILKHLKQFVQSDWLLPAVTHGFIWHDRDKVRGARGKFHTHATGNGLIHYNAGFYFHIESNSFVIINHFWSKFAPENVKRSNTFQCSTPEQSVRPQGDFRCWWCWLLRDSHRIKKVLCNTFLSHFVSNCRRCSASNEKTLDFV